MDTVRLVTEQVHGEPRVVVVPLGESGAWGDDEPLRLAELRSTLRRHTGVDVPPPAPGDRHLVVPTADLALVAEVLRGTGVLRVEVADERYVVA